MVGVVNSKKGVVSSDPALHSFSPKSIKVSNNVEMPLTIPNQTNISIPEILPASPILQAIMGKQVGVTTSASVAPSLRHQNSVRTHRSAHPTKKQRKMAEQNAQAQDQRLFSSMTSYDDFVTMISGLRLEKTPTNDPNKPYITKQKAYEAGASLLASSLDFNANYHAKTENVNLTAHANPDAKSTVSHAYDFISTVKNKATSYISTSVFGASDPPVATMESISEENQVASLADRTFEAQPMLFVTENAPESPQMSSEPTQERVNSHQKKVRSQRKKRFDSHHYYVPHAMLPVKRNNIKRARLAEARREGDIVKLKEIILSLGHDEPALRKEANNALKELLTSQVSTSALKHLLTDHELPPHAKILLHRYFPNSQQHLEKKHVEMMGHCNPASMLALMESIAPEMQMLEMVKTLEMAVINLIKNEAMSDEQKIAFRTNYLTSFKNKVAKFSDFDGLTLGASTMLSGGPMATALLLQNAIDRQEHKKMSSFTVEEIEGLEVGAQLWQMAMLGVPGGAELQMVGGGSLELMAAISQGRSDICQYLTTGIGIALGVKSATNRFPDQNIGTEKVEDSQPIVPEITEEGAVSRYRDLPELKAFYNQLKGHNYRTVSDTHLSQMAEDASSALKKAFLQQEEINAEQKLSIATEEMKLVIQKDNDGFFVTRNDINPQMKYRLIKQEHRHNIFKLQSEEGETLNLLFIEKTPGQLSQLIQTKRTINHVVNIFDQQKINNAKKQLKQIKKIVKNVIASNDHDIINDITAPLIAENIDVAFNLKISWSTSFGERSVLVPVVNIEGKQIVVDIKPSAHVANSMNNLLFQEISEWKTELLNASPSKKIKIRKIEISENLDEEIINRHCRSKRNLDSLLSCVRSSQNPLLQLLDDIRINKNAWEDSSYIGKLFKISAVIGDIPLDIHKIIEKKISDANSPAESAIEILSLSQRETSTALSVEILANTSQFITLTKQREKNTLSHLFYLHVNEEGNTLYFTDCDELSDKLMANSDNGVMSFVKLTPKNLEVINDWLKKNDYSVATVSVDEIIENSQQWKPNEQYTNLLRDNLLYIDNYKLIIKAHGFDGLTAMADGMMSGDELATFIANEFGEEINLKKIKEIDLLSCKSANGGIFSSQAQVLANKFKIPVTGYKNAVSLAVKHPETFTPRSSWWEKFASKRNKKIAEVQKQRIKENHPNWFD